MKARKEIGGMCSIILPTYNERRNIATLTEQINLHLGKTSKEILIVDDLSPDGTWKEAKSLSRRYPFVRTIVRKKNHGLAQSIKEGILRSRGEFIIIMDADLSHPPRYIPSLLKEMRENDLVVASRFLKGGKMVYHNKLQIALSKLINFFIRNALGIPLKDVTGGFFCIRRRTLKNINLDEIFTFYGDYFFHMVYHLKSMNMRIKEVPFTYEPRNTGKSKTKLLNVGFLYIRQTIRILINH